MSAELIAKLESASEGSRELGHEVLLHFGWHRSLVGHFYGPLYQWSAPDRKPCLISGDEDKLPNPVLSIDAALALAERVLPGWVWNMGNDVPCWVHMWIDNPTYDGNPVRGRAATPALAICAALLRASAAEGAGHD